MRRTFTAYLRLLRPAQWIKNLMLFFPPFLGGALSFPGSFLTGILPFASFCLLSSSTYIVNDIFDRDRDADHPRKRSRPIASGLIGLSEAVALSAVLAASSIAIAVLSPNRSIIGYLAVYLMVSLAYSCCLKNQPVIDLFCISTGFIIRLLAGGNLFSITVSSWLFLSVFLLAIFLSAGKRLHEQIALDVDAKIHRPVLASYPPGFLDGILYMTGGTVLVTYGMYTTSRPLLLYSVPLCCFGLMRYMLLVKRGKGGDPTGMLLSDPWLFAVGLVWVIIVGCGIYTH